MYLLKIDITAEAVIILVLSLALYVLLGIWIVKIGVKAGNKQLLNHLKYLHQLKVLEMKKAGVPLDEIKKAGGYFEELQTLQKQKEYLDNDRFLSTKKQLEETFA